MSHSITIQIQNKELHLSSCQNLRDKLNDIIKNKDVSEEVKNQIRDTISNIQSLESIIHNNDRLVRQEYMDLMRNLSTAEKTTANMFITAKDSVLNNLINSLPEDVNIGQMIAKHGVLAIETIEYLKNNNIVVNKDNFDKYINEVEQAKLSKEKVDAYITNAFKMIDGAKIPDSIKTALKKETKGIDNLNGIKDIFAVIQSKENEVIRTMELSKKILEMLKKQDFSIVGNSIWEYDEKTSDIIHKFALKNKANNTVQMIVDSTGHLRYKLGNYPGHACEATTERILKDLEAAGYTCNVISIKRDYEQQPKAMAKELPQTIKGGKK